MIDTPWTTFQETTDVCPERSITMYFTEEVEYQIPISNNPFSVLED